MKLKTLLAAAAAVALFSGTAGAATMSLSSIASYSFPGTYTITTTASELPSKGSTVYYELSNNPYDKDAYVTLVATQPVSKSIGYAVYQDSNTAAGNVTFDNSSSVQLRINDDPLSTIAPLFSFLMQAGKQYVLAITKMDEGRLDSVTTNVSAVPLPGAIWLFGSALLGFLGFSSRRKI